MNKIDEIAQRASDKIREAMQQMTEELNQEIRERPVRGLEVELHTELETRRSMCNKVETIVVLDAGVSITVKY